MKPWSRIHSKQQILGVCPRCEGLIPDNGNHRKYMGAISRLTRGDDQKQIEVCSPCGNDEGLQEHFEGFATPIKDWPIMTGEAIKRRSEAFAILMEITLEDGSYDEEDTQEPF